MGESHRLHPVIDIPTFLPVRPGGVITILCRMRDGVGLVQPHSDPRLSIRDPMGNWLLIEEPMTYDVVGNQGVTHYQLQDDAREGNYHLEVKMDIDATLSGTITHAANARLEVRRNV